SLRNPRRRSFSRYGPLVKLLQSIRLDSPIEAIPHAADADEMLWLRRVFFDLFAQVRDVRVHDAIAAGGIGPDFIEQLIAAQGAATAADECAQQLELDRRDL